MIWNWAHVYIVVSELESAPIKVGCTGNMACRLSTLRTITRDFTLSVAYFRTYDRRTQALAVESGVKQELAPTCIMGEWFDVDVPRMIRAINNAHLQSLDKSWPKEPDLAVGNGAHELRLLCEAIQYRRQMGLSIPWNTEIVDRWIKWSAQEVAKATPGRLGDILAAEPHWPATAD